MTRARRAAQGATSAAITVGHGAIAGAIVWVLHDLVGMRDIGPEAGVAIMTLMTLAINIGLRVSRTRIFQAVEDRIVAWIDASSSR